MNLKDRIDLFFSRFLNIHDCETVCLTVGPYRNLTTLTAATMFLHPNCQVLNHAGFRVFGNRSIDFLSDYNKARCDRFIQFAIKISNSGQRGDRGGSIIHSHAFDSKYKVGEIYKKSNSDFSKKAIKCLFWKESLATSNLIRDKNINIANIFNQDDRLKFLLPIRNPLDCAKSNIKTGHVSRFKNLNTQSSMSDVLSKILDEIHWVASYKEQFPDRFFYYFAHDISKEMLIRLSTFLKLEPYESWLLDANRIMKIQSIYEHDDDLIKFYQKIVKDKFSSFPILLKNLLKFSVQ